MAKIYLNAGHGNAEVLGSDPGSVNHNLGLTESRLAAVITGLAAGYLRDVGHEVREWQDDALSAIAKDVNNWGAQVSVSVHLNSVASESAKGIETWCYPGYPKDNSLATCIQNKLASTFPEYPDRGVKYNKEWAMLRVPTCPACLVELGFISNPEEAMRMANDPDTYARALAVGITDFIHQEGI